MKKIIKLFNQKPVAIFMIVVITFAFGTLVVKAALTLSASSVTSDGALNISAGGTNQNVVVTPSGLGFTVLNGNVGVGTSTPSVVFQVTGTSTATATSSLMLIGNSLISGGSATGTFLGINSASNYGGDFLNFQNGGTNVFRISGEGGIDVGNDPILFPTAVPNQIISTWNDSRINQAVSSGFMDHLASIGYWTPTTTNAGMVLNGNDLESIIQAGSSGTINQLTGVGATAHNLGATNITNTLGAINALAASAHNSGAGVVGQSNGVLTISANRGSGWIGTSTGVFVEKPSNDTGNNNVTSTYGIYIQDQNRGTNRWQMYSLGSAPVQFTVNTANTIPLILQAAPSQTANLQEWRDSTGTALSTITSAGGLGVGTSTPVAWLHLVNGTGTTTLAIGSGNITTNRGLLCQWNGSSYTITSFALNSIVPIYSTSTLCQ